MSELKIVSWPENVRGVDYYIAADVDERIAALTVERDAEKASKDMAYSERDRLVCALSKIFSAHLERHPDSDMDWENDWRWIVFVQFPTGQASWHIHDSELGWFDHLEREDGNSWDGHSTTEKYARVQRFEAIGNMKLLEAENAALKAELQACREPMNLRIDIGGTV